MERNRVEGWQYAKLSGHKNEDLVARLVIENTMTQRELLSCANKRGLVTGVVEGGICEQAVPSILGDNTKAKPDLKVVLDDGQYVNVSIKKSRSGQVFLVSAERFIRGFETQYKLKIPLKVKRAIELFWGCANDCNQILEQYAVMDIPYQMKRHRLVKDTLDRYDSNFSQLLLKWFQDNIVAIFDFCFVRGLALNRSDWADVIWYKNLLNKENDENIMFNLEDIKTQLVRKNQVVQYGTKTGGSTIRLPFGFVQWHQGQMQFHHNFNAIKSILTQ